MFLSISLNSISPSSRSATPDTLMQVCQDNREELARVLDIKLEDVVMTWVSEMQCMVSRRVKFLK